MDKPILMTGPTGPYAHGYKMCMVKYIDGIVRSVTWHRYLYERTHGRLPSTTHVHHQNGDKSDNRLENLEAKPIAVHARDHREPASTQTYICPWCGIEFDRDDRTVKHNQKQQKKAGPFCSRSCGASWGREKQLGRL